MCFIKQIYKSSHHLEARIATRPIRVLKVGRMLSDEFTKRGFLSIAYPKLYRPGQIETQCHPIIPEIEEINYNSKYYLLIVERGFHSYRSIYTSYINPYCVDLSQEKNWNRYINLHSVGNLLFQWESFCVRCYKTYKGNNFCTRMEKS